MSTSIGSKCNICSTGEHVSIDFSALHIDFGCNSAECSRGRTRQDSCHSKKKVATGLKKHFIYNYIILIFEGSRTIKQKGEP